MTYYNIAVNGMGPLIVVKGAVPRVGESVRLEPNGRPMTVTRVEYLVQEVKPGSRGQDAAIVVDVYEDTATP